MRNIEFRGKDIETGEWRYGFYSQFHNRPLVNEPNIHQIFELLEENSSPIIFGNTAIGGLWFTINENTLGQFTGLKDKNGTKIYEGDIIKRSDGIMYVIRYIYGGFDTEPINEYFKKPKITWNTLGEMQNALWVKDNCEVVGNISDNPEMLENNEDK